MSIDSPAQTQRFGAPIETSRTPTPQPRIAVCPYCGEETSPGAQCAQCKGLLDPLSKQATQNAMGPWCIRDESQPFRPGCSFETLVAQIAKGRVRADSVIRGPGTRQFWMRASQVPGIASRLGVCHACQASVAPGAASCASCGAPFDVETDRQYLGLSPVRLLPGHAAAEQVAANSLIEPRAEAPRARRAPATAISQVAAMESTAGPSPEVQPASGAAVVRGSDRGLKVAVAVLSVACVALVAAIVLVLVFFPSAVEEVQKFIGTNK
ncbi:MAG: hypothetical protein AB7G11_16755 [Phycisphaerales bacterium]